MTNNLPNLTLEYNDGTIDIIEPSEIFNLYNKWKMTSLSVNKVWKALEIGMILDSAFSNYKKHQISSH